MHIKNCYALVEENKSINYSIDPVSRWFAVVNNAISKKEITSTNGWWKLCSIISINWDTSPRSIHVMMQDIVIEAGCPKSFLPTSALRNKWFFERGFTLSDYLKLERRIKIVRAYGHLIRGVKVEAWNKKK